MATIQLSVRAAVCQRWWRLPQIQLHGSLIVDGHEQPRITVSNDDAVQVSQQPDFRSLLLAPNERKIRTNNICVKTTNERKAEQPNARADSRKPKKNGKYSCKLEVSIAKSEAILSGNSQQLEQALFDCATIKWDALRQSKLQGPWILHSVAAVQLPVEPGEFKQVAFSIGF